MDTFKVSHFGLVACFNECVEARLHKLCNTTTKNCLFTKEVSFSFFSEACFKNTRSTCSDTRSVSQCYVLSSAGVVLIYSDQGRNTLAFEVLRSNRVTGALRSDHYYVDILCGLNEVKVNVKTVSKAKNVAFLHVGSNLLVVNICAKLIGNEHHYYVSGLSCVLNLHNLEVGMCICKRLCLGIVSGVGSETDNYVYTRFSEILGMRVALRTKADNCYCFTVKD